MFQYLFWGNKNQNFPCLCLPALPWKSLENRVVSYIAGKVWIRRLQRRWNRRKRFSNDGVIPRISLLRWILGGDWLWKSVWAFWRVGIATYGCLGCFHRLCRKGDGSSHWKYVWRFQEGQVNIGLLCIFPISPLPHIEFWTNLVSTESYHRGLSNVLRARRSDGNSWRTWEVTGINHLTQAVMNGAFLIRLDCRWMSFHSSRVLLRFSIISEGIWDVLEVKEWVSLVGFQGFRDL